MASATKFGMHNVLLNLLLNAADALTTTDDVDGRITITTESFTSAVVIRVKDNGIGMSEDARRRVFEPFFTTKANVGTGLGLSTAYATVRRWGGKLDVRSTLGEGTTFTITLVPWQNQGVIDLDTEREEPPVAMTPARILVVEDDDLIRDVVRAPLEDAGHKLYVAADGRQAIELMRDHDLALIDLGIPYISGDRVAITLKQYDPRISTILMTGWDLDEGDPRLGALDFRVPKAIELDQLHRTLAYAIDRTLSQTVRTSKG